MTAWRLLLRFAVCLVALLSIDTMIAPYAPAPEVSRDQRLPRTLPTARIDAFVEQVAESAQAAEHPTVAFIGASPVWGDAVSRASDTVPAMYRKAAEQDGRDISVYNLACNGQLLGDSYFVARSVADDVDLVIVQLTYHGFNPRWRQGVTRRYPELATRLGVPVSGAAAEALGCDPTVIPDVTGATDRWLRRRWKLYGAREALGAQLFRASPETAMYARWERVVKPGFLGEDEPAPSGAPFDTLDPEQQMLVMDEWASAADYEVSASDSELRMLELLARDLEREGVRTVFYVSPLNVDALTDYDLFDQQAYERNTAVLREVVESHGHRFLDLNAETTVPSSMFADVNHTTAEGCELLGRTLAETTTGDLGGAR